MSRPLAFVIAAALAAAGAVHAQAKSPEWIERSNADAKVLLDATARFSPESASQIGIPGYDDKVTDLKPGIDERTRAAMVEVKGKLQKLLVAEKDANVRQDLQIMLKSVDEQIEGIDLNRQYMLPVQDVAQLIFNGKFVLLKVA